MEIMPMQMGRMVMLSTTSKHGQNPCYKLKAVSCSARQTGNKNYYEVLGLHDSKNIGLAEIKKSYRKLALQYHPDVCPASDKEECIKRFLELQTAYQTLSDPGLRRRYDYEMDLVDSIGYGFDGSVFGGRNSIFPTEVWEKQVEGLRKRSQLRMQMRKSKFDK